MPSPKRPVPNPSSHPCSEPDADCGRCPRLVEFRETQRRLHPDWFNGAVPSFGDPKAWLLIVGLAPGLQGANRTGRPFTGDYAGDLLYRTLLDFKLASGRYESRADDGLTLRGCMITNAVRCVPPQNKPTPAEVNTCRSFLLGRIEALDHLKAIIALGRIAHDTTLATLGMRKADHPFVHASMHNVRTASGRRLCLIDSYHCSRYNTNTGRLTAEMFRDVFIKARGLARPRPSR